MPTNKYINDHLICNIYTCLIYIYIYIYYTTAVARDLVYSGSKRLTDPVEGVPLDVGKLVR